MKRRKTKHHLTPRCRYKRGYRPVMNSPSNLLSLYRDKHQAWHSLFKEATIEEAIKLLKRVCRMKRRKSERLKEIY